MINYNFTQQMFLSTPMSHISWFQKTTRAQRELPILFRSSQKLKVQLKFLILNQIFKRHLSIINILEHFALTFRYGKPENVTLLVLVKRTPTEEPNQAWRSIEKISLNAATLLNLTTRMACARTAITQKEEPRKLTYVPILIGPFTLKVYARIAI